MRPEKLTISAFGLMQTEQRLIFPGLGTVAFISSPEILELEKLPYLMQSLLRFTARQAAR